MSAFNKSNEKLKLYYIGVTDKKSNKMWTRHSRYVKKKNAKEFKGKSINFLEN